ncbi:MAG: hypothetical protein PHV59_04980, partial [Victivallales bacterium]|nr:hypothetical protein [Victivallales bacterium]
MRYNYQIKDHVQPLEILPRTYSSLDQREVTIYSYTVDLPFDYDSLDKGIDSAWLTPQNKFGVFSRIQSESSIEKDSLTVVLGLQDDLHIRAYDYDNRRPLYFSWQNSIVDTVNIHYFKDKDGMLRFTTIGGGNRITEQRLKEFNSTFLNIPEVIVNKMHFNLDLLRDLCFEHFIDRLYKIKFSDPSGAGYRSIDHALFQSRQYIDPEAERLKEIKDDAEVRLESFDSDIDVIDDMLQEQIRVRFFISGMSGSLRLRIPKIQFKKEPGDLEEQTKAFYKIVDIIARSIIDADFYVQNQYSLESLNKENPDLFPDLVDLAPYLQVLANNTHIEDFFNNTSFAESWTEWQPHLRAINQLIASEEIKTNTACIIKRITKSTPLKAALLLNICQNDSQLLELGNLIADIVQNNIHEIPSESRAQVEENLLAWAISHEEDRWDIVLETAEITVYNQQYKKDDVRIDT